MSGEHERNKSKTTKLGGRGDSDHTASALTTAVTTKTTKTKKVRRMLRKWCWRCLHTLKLAAILLSILQLIVFLPLSLEHSQETFLTFSALMATFYFTITTLRWATTNTSLAPITRFLVLIQNLIIPLTLFMCARLYMPDSIEELSPRSVPWLQSASIAKEWLMSRAPFTWRPPSETVIRSEGASHLLESVQKGCQYILSHVPGVWYSFLLYMSPVFSLLEGIASLLVVQCVARFSQWLYVFDAGDTI